MVLAGDGEVLITDTVIGAGVDTLMPVGATMLGDILGMDMAIIIMVETVTTVEIDIVYGHAMHLPVLPPAMDTIHA